MALVYGHCRGRTVTCKRTRGASFLGLKRVGVRVFDDSEVGVPSLETEGYDGCRFAERGLAKRDGAGDCICMARTFEGVLKGCRVIFRGEHEESLGPAEAPLGSRENASPAASSPTI